jgi:hypothetical protein
VVGDPDALEPRRFAATNDRECRARQPVGRVASTRSERASITADRSESSRKTFIVWRMAIVDDLLAHPGLYVGIDSVADSDLRGAARIVVTALPGGAGVALDYEVLNAATPDRIRGHIEHTVIARTHDGSTVMVIGHAHASSVAILRETEAGTFEVGDEGSPFPMKVVVSMPQPGRLRHAWWYGSPGGEAIERDVSELTLLP